MKIKIWTFIGVILVALGTVWFDRLLVKPEKMLVKKQENIVNISDAISVPDFTVEMLDGSSVAMGDIREEVVLLSFWASWCVPCIREIPEMLDLVERFNGRVALLTISIDDQLSDVKSFLGKLDDYHAKNTYWAWDRDKSISLNLFNTMRVPETIIVNQERLMVKKIVGPVKWNSDAMIQLINNVLNNSPI